MGMTHVTVAVRNPAKPGITWEGLFLADTGAVDSLAPGKFLRKIGLLLKSERTYELADGSKVKRSDDGAFYQAGAPGDRAGMC